jgi:hypothetical protein
VTTGQYDADELDGADAVARDTVELRAALEAIGI